MALVSSLVLAGLVAWALWPTTSGPTGPSITDRAKQPLRVAGPVSSRVISAEDLPPEGTRSLFDHLVAQHGALPYPFEQLAAMIAAQDPTATPPVQVMIPHGRSLLKAQADFTLPRVLFAADFQAPNTDVAWGLAPRGQLFLGFVEGADEIEVISYNDLAGRFEFQLVQDYCEDCVPRIVYAKRAVCTTCHQGAAPIFPQRPWSETNGQPAISERIIAARGAPDYLGIPVDAGLKVPERFDELTDVGNFIPVTQRTWLDGCGEGDPGDACRRAMLEVALRFAWDPGGFDPQSAAAGRLRAAQAAQWPHAGLAVPDADLRNRDPLPDLGGLRGWLREMFNPEAREPGARSNEDLGAFERLPPLPAAQDPLTPRPPQRVLGPDDLDGAYGIAQLLTRQDVSVLEAAAVYDIEALAAAVQALPDEVVAAAPVSRIGLLSALLSNFGAPPRNYAFHDVSGLSPPIALGEPPLELAAGSVLEPYRDYCFACHRGNPAARLDFMSGRTEEEVLTRIEDTPSIRDVLDWERYAATEKAGTLMPPADSTQRAALEAALAAGEPALEDMRKVVPSLFDF